ncbi:MAG: DUF3108 domain-containing protein [Acetobacter orientalis]|uniref:DUF3108 domain-containing protein n=1 Tax=Acetobacter orientalis TaxID=146474 RepID=UPI0039EC665B
MPFSCLKRMALGRSFLGACAALGMSIAPVGLACAQEPRPPQTALTYSVFVHGLHVMNIQASYWLSDQQYGVAAQVKTTALFGLFMKTDLSMQAQGRVDGRAVEPEKFTTAGWSRRSMRRATIVYKDGMPEVSVLEPAETDREPVTQEERKGAVDVLSALIGILHQARSQQSCQGQEKLFDGLRLTTLALQTAGTVKLPSGGPWDWGETGLRCNFVGQQVKGFHFSSDKSKLHNPQPGRVWFENIGNLGLVAVRIELDHPKLGRINVLLSSTPKQYP